MGMAAALGVGRFKVLAVAAMAVVFLAGAAHAEEIVRVGGAGSGLGGMKLLGKAFEASRPGTRVEVFASLGSSGGIKALLAGSLDLAVSGRALKPEELKGGASALQYATTPFVFATNQGVSKRDITSSELEKIYQGGMLKWPDGAQIRLVLRPESDTDTLIIKSISPLLREAAKTAASRRGMIYAVTDQDCDSALVTTPGAVGPSTLAEITTEKRAVNILSFNGVKPSVQALAQGKYPLAKPHYLVTRANSSAAAQAFLRFVESPRGRAILSRVGYLPPAAVKGH
jgi:phosphate transport system substrate-binding protein